MVGCAGESARWMPQLVGFEHTRKKWLVVSSIYILC